MASWKTIPFRVLPSRHPKWDEQLSPHLRGAMRYQCSALLSGKLSMPGLLVASFPYPAKQAWEAVLRQGGFHDKAYKHFADESAQAAGDIGWPGFIIRRKLEEYGVVLPQSNGLSEIGETERPGRLACQFGGQTVSAMSAHDSRSESAHAHVRDSWILDGQGRVANCVDVGMRDRTQEGIDENLVALIDRQASFFCQRLHYKASRPDAQIAGQFAPLVENEAPGAHGAYFALIDDLDAQALQPAPHNTGHALVPGESERPARHQADLDVRIDACHLRRGFDAGGSSATDHHLAACGLDCGKLLAQG